MTAVFPRGQYDTGKGGLRAVIPANTVFLLGKPEDLGPPRQTAAANAIPPARADGQIVPPTLGGPLSTYIDTAESVPETAPRRAGRAPAASPALSTEPRARDESALTVTVARLFVDPEFRDQRVARLLRLASERAGRDEAFPAR